jgi:Zn-dependent metalloprotease
MFMRKKILFSLCAMSCFLTFYAQNHPPFTVVYQHKNGSPAAIQFKNNQLAPSPEGLVVWMKNNLNANADFDLKITHNNTDVFGITHIKYQQIYKNIPVMGLELIVHLKNNKVYLINGNFIPNFSINSTSNINENDAIQSAIKTFPNSIFKWELPQEEFLIKKIKNDPSATYFPKAILMYYCPTDTFAMSDFKLCYEMSIYSVSPLSHELIYVDAQTSEIIDRIEQICSIDYTGIAHTRYHGIKEILTDSVGQDSFVLFDKSRGKGILTMDVRITQTDSIRNFSDSNNVWNNANYYQDDVATDVHWGTEMTFDYYKKTFNRISYDNDSSMILSRVHVGEKFNNAFWDGFSANYGDGDSSKMLPLTSIDVVSHEITHGVTGNSSNLRYRNESGALNESFSDIFAKCIEVINDSSTFDWYLGKRLQGPNGKPFRNMADPNELNHPKYYLGKFFHTEASDNGGVHINSGIQNHWFYLLVNGGNGKREDEKFYNVTGIGFEKASQIAFLNNTEYLFRSATYIDAVEMSMSVAEDLFGEGSFEQEQVKRAWHAVGFFNEININEIKTVEWTLLPNPGNSYFQLFNNNGIESTTISITDMTGKLIFSGNYFKSEKFDTSALQSGIYFIKINEKILKWVKA